VTVGRRPVPGALGWAVAELARAGCRVAVEVAGIAVGPASIGIGIPICVTAGSGRGGTAHLGVP
jgi:hypothetical protein